MPNPDAWKRSLKHDGGYRVLVYGGRDFTDEEVVYRALDKVHRARGVLCVITGMARGADSLAWEWAKANRIPTAEYPISRGDWQTYGKGAGPIRNQRMLDQGLPDVAIEFPGGSGTRDMRRRLDEKGVPVYEPCARSVESP